MQYPGYNRYVYDGPVNEFDRCICQRWTGSTYAVSEKKARANLEFRYKKENGKAPHAKVHLPGKLELIR